MTPYIRYILQLLLWLGMWCIIWIATGAESQFIRENGPTFLLQFLLLFGLINYAVPRFLFKSKYFYFFVFTVSIVFLFASLSVAFGPESMVNRIPRPIGRPNMPRIDRAPPLMRSRFFMQMLIMTITCIFAILIETFILAQQKEKSEAQAKAELIESELKFLKMQINPHFLFNALNNIYALSVINSAKTQKGISTLSNMLRYVLYDSEQAEVPLHKEMAYIKHFVELFKLKSSEAYKINYVEEVEGTALMVAPMLFVSFIENAFKHSGIEKRGDSFVNISLAAKDNIIKFSVENSLPSDVMEHDAQGGIGLQNVKKRLNILYPKQHELDIQKSNTFIVHLKINIK